MLRLYSLLPFILLFFLSCSHFSKNQVKRSSFSISGGRSASGSWGDTLNFKRISWYREWSLVFDLFYTRLDATSPFYGWISKEEKDFLNKCRDYYIVMTYHPLSGVISDAFFLDRAERFGYERIFLDEFDKQLRMHPGLTFFSLSLYNVYALCRMGQGSSKALALDIPGFNQVEL